MIKISDAPLIEIRINDNNFELIIDGPKDENKFSYCDLKFVKLLKGKKLYLSSFLFGLIDCILNWGIAQVYKGVDTLVLYKNNKIIRKQLNSEEINYTNLEIAIITINKNITRHKTMHTIV